MKAIPTVGAPRRRRRWMF